MGGDIQNRFAKGEKDRSSIKGAGGNIIQISKRSIQRPAAPYGLSTNPIVKKHGKSSAKLLTKIKEETILSIQLFKKANLFTILD